MARLMPKNNIHAKQNKEYKSAAKRNKAHPVAPHQLKWQFAVERQDQIWLSVSAIYRPGRGSDIWPRSWTRILVEW